MDRSMKPAASPAMMNKAEMHQPKSGHSAPASGNPGPEKKAAMEAALGGGPSDGLRGAVNELKSQHPIAHHDHGPHHGDSTHIRHQPVGKVYR